LKEFSPYLPYYKCYINNIFGLWIPPKTQHLATWNRFKKKPNGWGSLEWVVENPSNKMVFLDLNIELHHSTIDMNTFQKPLNLYLCTPPRSAHPPSCLKGLITRGIMMILDAKQSRTISIIWIKFIEHLISRGHVLKNLILLLEQAAVSSEDYANTNPSNYSPIILYTFTGSINPMSYNGRI